MSRGCLRRLPAAMWAAGILALLAAAGLASWLSGPAAASRAPSAHQADAQQCPDPYPAARDATNPLDLPTAPGPDPLNGAHFFVDGPRHGEAAGAIAQLLGKDPTRYKDGDTWAKLKANIATGRLHRRLARNHKLARKVQLLEKIADQPEAQRFSLYSAGGGPGAIFAQVQKIFCHNMTADPGSIPIITTYFLYQAGYCETSSEIISHRPTFERQVNEMVQGIENRPAVMLLELDAIGSSSCMAPTGALTEWENDIRYEIGAVSALPHAVVYIEGGYSDGASPSYTARVLNAVGVRNIRGFYTNDTHMQWTANEIRWGLKVSSMTGGAHFIINTADNGHGPLLNPHPVKQGIEDLCNPPGRGAGIPTTTDTGNQAIDAFMWVHVPGTSSGKCNGGTPSGTFWLARALTEARNANAQLGPHYKSRPF
ncbi:MAG: glycoside hydrolase family 6 protein [Solirubrobacteraceae bacterium]